MLGDSSHWQISLLILAKTLWVLGLFLFLCPPRMLCPSQTYLWIRRTASYIRQAVYSWEGMPRASEDMIFRKKFLRGRVFPNCPLQGVLNLPLKHLVLAMVMSQVPGLDDPSLIPYSSSHHHTHIQHVISKSQSASQRSLHPQPHFTDRKIEAQGREGAPW